MMVEAASGEFGRESRKLDQVVTLRKHTSAHCPSINGLPSYCLTSRV